MSEAENFASNWLALQQWNMSRMQLALYLGLFRREGLELDAEQQEMLAVIKQQEAEILALIWGENK